MLLLIRVLYECLPSDVIILPANHKRLHVAAAGAVQSLWREAQHNVNRSVSTSDVTRKSDTPKESSDLVSRLSRLIETDAAVLKLLEQLF